MKGKPQKDKRQAVGESDESLSKIGGKHQENKGKCFKDLGEQKEKQKIRSQGQAKESIKMSRNINCLSCARVGS